MEDLKFNTGDLLLFDTNIWYSKILEYFLDKQYSHIAIILKNPHEWLDANLTEEYYILECGIEKYNDKIIDGVQIIPLSFIYDKYINKGFGNLYVRHISHSLNERELQQKIRIAYNKVKSKPYDLDPFDWLLGYKDLNKHIEDDENLIEKYQKTNRFWCSALVTFIFVECLLIDKNIPWTLISPNDYIDFNRIKLLDCSFGKILKI